VFKVLFPVTLTLTRREEKRREEKRGEEEERCVVADRQIVGSDAIILIRHFIFEKQKSNQHTP
jgi:hypothetical protein